MAFAVRNPKMRLTKWFFFLVVSSGGGGGGGRGGRSKPKNQVNKMGLFFGGIVWKSQAH